MSLHLHPMPAVSGPAGVVLCACLLVACVLVNLDSRRIQTDTRQLEVSLTMRLSEFAYRAGARGLPFEPVTNIVWCVLMLHEP